MPNARVLPVLLARAGARARASNITLLNGLGTHRPNTTEELERMLGPRSCTAIPSCSTMPGTRSDLVDLGTTRYGHRAVVNRALSTKRRFKILTGFIEPHFFAGFSGGPKAVLPGIAGFRGDHG